MRMKRHFTIVAVLWGVACLPALANESRKERLFNQDYRFALGEYKQASQVAFDDHEWERGGLPHSFSIPYFRSPYFYVGEGWYRKTFPVGSSMEGRRLRLDFEGVFQKCEVFVNGKSAGGHEGGYTGFSIDLTPHIKQGDNTLAIRVNNEWEAQLPPRAGEHVFSGGIYRDVKLVETADLHVVHNGLRVATPTASRQAATVQASLNVQNAASELRSFSVAIKILSPDGKVVGKSMRKGSLAAGKRVVVSLPPVKFNSPRLWHPDHPHLYTAKVAILEDGKIIDSVGTRFGVRWFKFSADHGFSLNGNKLWLRGANRHQDHAGWGDAVANSAHYRDAKLIKDAGFNFVRGSHYPHDPAFLDACDELGLLMLSENTFWGIGGFGKDGNWRCSAYPPNEADQAGFEANDKRLLGEMIADHYNHPSVILWSMSNEPFFTHKRVMDKAKAHMQDLVNLTHQLDPSRPAIVGGAQRAGFDKIGDVIGYNGDGATFKKPALPSMVSEYGSYVSNRPGKYDPTWGCTKGEMPEWRAGHALWCAFHHGSIAGDMGRMGMVDYFRLPLRQWYWYRNHYAKIAPPEWPKEGNSVALSLTTSTDRISNDGTQDAHLVVTVLGADGKRISAAPEIKLEIVSGPGEFPTGPSITFKHNTDIDVRDGLAAIAFRSWHGGKTVIRATAEDLKPVTITIQTRGTPEWKPELAAAWQKPRAYRAKPISEKACRESRDNLAFVRPTRVSSQEGKNPADHANDGDPNSRWCAANGRTPAYWQVDLENFYLIEKVALHMEKDGDYRYCIETTVDGDNWETIYMHKDGGQTTAKRTHKIDGAPRARFLRVTFTQTPPEAWPSLREVVVSGKSAQ